MTCLEECNCEFIVQFFDDNDLPQEIRITPDPGNSAKYNLHVKSMNHITNTAALSFTGNIVGSTATIYNTPFASTKGFIHGFNLSSKTDTKYTILIRGIKSGIFKTNIINLAGEYWFKQPILVSSGDTIVITGDNCGEITDDYEGSLYWEVITT